MREPFGISLFCDDVREEKGGKRTYVGVHNRLLKIAADKPVTIPRLCIVSHIVVPSEFVFDSFQHEVTLLREGGEESIWKGVHKPPPPSLAKEKAVKAIAIIEISPIELQDDCEVRVRAVFGELIVPMGTLVVRFIASEPSEVEIS